MLVIILLAVLYGMIWYAVRSSSRRYARLSDEELERENRELHSILENVKSEKDRSLVERCLQDLQKEVQRRDAKK